MLFFSRLRRRRAEGDRGAVVTEFALLAPLLALIVAGVLEFGLAWRDSMTVSNALRSGARVGSNAGREREADFTILKSLQAAMAEVPTTRIERIIVYEATTSDSDVPEDCLSIVTSGGVDGSCNVYVASDLARPASDFDGGPDDCSTTAPDRYWCPADRQSQQALGADYLGVWMQVRYDYVTGIFPGDGLTIRDRAIMRLEPRIDD